MKLTILALFATVLANSIIDLINNDPNSTWQAYQYPPEIITLEKVRQMCGTQIPVEEGDDVAPLDSNALPADFDARERWPGKLLPIHDQGKCGSCWAFAVAESAEHRLSIKGCDIGAMSPQDLVECDHHDSGCNGGMPHHSWEWAHTHGITTETCIPYVSGGGQVPTCRSKCINGSDIHRIKAKKIGHISAKSMQQTLFNDGPFEVTFNVFEDFYYYKSGIYQARYGGYLGGHAVVIIGWGVENDVHYWIVQNSWGEKWGENGYFRIIRGKNECQVESHAWQGHFSC
ncbi:MAG: putative cathepsin B5 cysteine protease [Streblomastix strix]|uniref:Putative cathepsin B5 cysteine protease n=1 Tax=Streblomastix strix TaxID=222440 RepID=A0A5J4W5M4_9EUKA|nr:MAG: putative cathepsin B5 cysteine protease [Streblomastix strix]